MEELNACAECGYTTINLSEFSQHIEHHEKGEQKHCSITTTMKEEPTELAPVKIEPKMDAKIALENAKLLANFANFSRLITNGSSLAGSVITSPKIIKEEDNGLKMELKQVQEDRIKSPLPVPEIFPVEIKKSGSKSGRGSKGEKTVHSCPHCNFTTYMSQHMKSHLEAHERHQGQMYQCDICQMQFSQKANMHRHRMRHTGVKPYKCRFCQKNFFRKDQMQEHSMTHIKTGEDFDCPVAQCPRQFHQHSSLRQHLDDEHIISATQQASCKRCALLFSNSRRLLLHYQTKHDDLAGVESSPQKRPSSHESLMSTEVASPLSPEQLDMVSTALKLISNGSECDSMPLEDSKLVAPPAKRRRVHGQSSESGVAKASIFPKTVEELSKEVNLSVVGPCSVIRSSEGHFGGEPSGSLGSAFSALPFGQSFLPRSKSPDCRGLVFNGYNSYDLLAKLSSAQNNFNSSKVHRHSMPSMQLWTNAANSLSSATTSQSLSSSTTSSNSEVRIQEEHDHSSTHSPSASSSSISSANEAQPSCSNSTTDELPIDYCTARTISTTSTTSTSSLMCMAVGSPGGLKEPLECLPCGIVFMDQTLHLIHKGLHSESDVWRCNLCGHTCADKYTFTTHLISSDHS
uniref:C2H2-type domain-containing protein n=1 Tax=Ditylenchus dipsaci TaxID=166011 RepID=A0A915E329_9BILA